MVNCVECDLDRVAALLLGVHRHPDALGEDTELLACGGTVDVGTDQQRTFALGRFQLLGEFAGECGLTRTLETGHENHRRLALGVEGGRIAAHEFGEFVMHNLDHQLLRLQGVDYVLSESLLLDSVGESLGDLIVDIGVKKCASHILEGLGYIDLGDSSLTFENFERAFKPLG